MIVFFLCLLIVILLFIGLALLLPVKFCFMATGGDDSEVRVEGRLILFTGLLSLGGSYSPGGSRMTLYIGKWKILEGNAAPVAHYIWNMDSSPQKRKEPAKPKKKWKRILSEHINTWRRISRKHSIPWGTVLRELRKLLVVDRFDVRFTFGVGDPALTGQILGILHAVNGFLPRRYVIVPEGDFSRRMFSGKADIMVTFRTHLFWVLLVRGFRAFLRIRGKGRTAAGDCLTAREA